MLSGLVAVTVTYPTEERVPTSVTVFPLVMLFAEPDVDPSADTVNVTVPCESAFRKGARILTHKHEWVSDSVEGYVSRATV